MSLRFQRRIKIAPGVRLNMSLGGISLTTGIKGASLTFSRRGLYANLGLPGSGLHYRTRLGSLSGGGDLRALGDGDVQLDLGDDGRLLLLDGAGEPLSRSRARAVRRDRGVLIEAWLVARRDALNQDRQRAMALHLDTPDPSAPPALADPPVAPPSQPPAPYAPSTWESLMAGSLSWVRQRIDEHRLASQRAISEWERAASARRVAEARAVDIRADPQALEDKLGAVLAGIPWPRETAVSLAVRGESVLLDVDLPELEDMPRQDASVSKRPVGIRLKDRSQRALREDYMRHVHAVGFRLVGQVFQAAPGASLVVISACTQRPDPATGRQVDVYLYSARVPRDAWCVVDFGALDQLDPAAALGRFELRRSVSKTGIFKPIEPFDA